MRQGDGADLLGSYDSRSASIGVIYVDPSDDRQRVLTAILTQDKLGRKQVVVVLPEHNKAFQRPADFDGLKNMRRGLKTEIVFVAPRSTAEFARQRRFSTYSSLESLAQSLKAEALVNGTPKRGTFGFIRKPKQTNANGMPAVSSSHIEDESTLPLPDNAPVAASQQASEPSISDPGENIDEADESTESNAAAMGMAGLAASVGLGSLAGEQSASSTLENSGADSFAQSLPVTGSQVDENASSNNTPVQASPNGEQSKAGPGIIILPGATPRPRITSKFPVSPSDAAPVAAIAAGSAMQSSGSNAAPPDRQGDSGNMAALGTGAAMASRTSAGVGGGPPPGGSSPGGPGGGGGGVGGSRRRTRLLLAILLIVLTVLLITGIAVAALVSGTAITSTVTITPDSKSGADTTDTFVITALTSVTKPDLAKRQVGARILTPYTTPPQMKTANATGSIPGRQATGQLTFLNTSNTTRKCLSKTLTGTSGVPVSFNGPVTVPAVPGFATLTGFAVNSGTAGNIRALDINQPFCATGITVKNGAFSGGQDAVPNTIIQQSDINGAAVALIDKTLKPEAQAALQKQVEPNEQVAPNTFQCKKSTFNADHGAGDIAKTVTVTVAITCTEEVYDQQGALTMAATLLKAEKDRQFTGYALTGNIVTGVTMITVNKTVLTLDVGAQGVWVYQFSDQVKQSFKNHIANMSKENALKYLISQPGVAGVQIEISSGNTLPDASHITINIKPIPGATGTPTVTPGSPTVVPTTPTAVPTPTPGLGGS